MPNCNVCKVDFDSDVVPAPKLCPACVFRTVVVPKLSERALDDACLSATIVYGAAGSKVDTVCRYLVDALMLDTQEEMVSAVEGEAATAALIRTAQSFPTFLLIHLRSLDALSLFSKVSASDMKACVDALVDLARRTTVDVCIGKTEWDGNLHISLSDVKKGQLAMTFSMAHEFGHGADNVLRHPSFPIGQGVRDLIIAAAGIGPTGFKNAEYFADAFAALFLRAAWRNGGLIIQAGNESIGTELPTPDYPSGKERTANVLKLVSGVKVETVVSL